MTIKYYDIQLKDDSNNSLYPVVHKTFYNDSIVTGSYGSTKTNLIDFVNEIRLSPGATGSVRFNSDYYDTDHDITIPGNMWYNFEYIPHRTGYIHEPDNDNHLFGNLLLYNMHPGNVDLSFRIILELKTAGDPGEVKISVYKLVGSSGGGGSVESVGATGILSSTGGTTPVISHKKPESDPTKSVSGVYPITIDTYGHITTSGSEVDMLPEVTGTDNGKILRVSNGEWIAGNESAFNIQDISNSEIDAIIYGGL